ncbi:hypothetical protein MBLNU457_4174t1 [Dothideomycetes sp. NU457]
MSFSGPLLQKLHARLTADEIAELFGAVSNMQPATSQSAFAPPTPQRNKRTKKTTRGKSPGAFTFAISEVQTPPANSIAPARPLNSWMAFRSYYSPVFRSFQQKEISGLMTRLWQNDPFKAKWSIIAKAYSMIREHTAKSAAPLDTFLALICPYIGMVGRDEYLAVMGWSVDEEDGQKKMKRRFIPETRLFPEKILTTNLSAEQVVSYCYEAGYVQTDGSNIMSGRSEEATLTMAAQPPSMPLYFDRQSADELGMYPAQSYSSNVDFGESISNLDALDHNTLRAQQQQLADMNRARAPTNEHKANAVSAGASLTQAVNAIDQSGSQYPFNDQFDPYNSNTVLFDPYIGDSNQAFSMRSADRYAAFGDLLGSDANDLERFLSDDIFDITK